MWREGAILLFIAMACTVVGAAASLAFQPGSLAAVQLAVPRCTNAGIDVIQNLSGYDVASVTISDIPASCGHAVAQVTVNNGSANGSGSGTVPGAGGSLTVNLAAAPGASTSHQTDILLTGP